MAVGGPSGGRPPSPPRRRPDRDAALAVAALRAGELVVYPTDTLYALGCDALSPRALDRLSRVKGRELGRGITVVIGRRSMLAMLSSSVGEAARRLAERLWPGPLTILVPARPELPAALVRDGLVGARLPDHPLARVLSEDLGGPIAAPSANPAGAPTARDVEAARAYFGATVAVYLDGGVLEGPPSTLVAPGPPLRILREGAVPRARIEEALG